jgi:hypothetical protein
MERASKAALKTLLGTDDHEVIKANEQSRLALVADAEKRRLADLTEIDRQKEIARLANERATQAEERTAEVEERQQYAEVDGQLKTVATEYIEPKFWRHVKTDLSSHIAGKWTAEQLETVSEADQEKATREFFADYVKENPEYAKKGTAAPVVPKVPLTNGAANPAGGQDEKPPPLVTTGKFAGKTAKPGHPNSMTNAEFREWKKEQGFTA